MAMSFSRLRHSFAIWLAVLLAAVSSTSTTTRSQEASTGPVQILVAYGAGGGTDTLARLVAGPLSRILNRPVVVQNLPGGGGQVAATTLLRDGGDGSAILATNEPDLGMSVLFNKPPYKREDFQTIMVDVLDPRIILVKKTADINTLADFVARAKAEPGKIAVSSTQGGAQELFAKWLFARLGINVRIVGYSGGGPASNAMLAGDVIATIGDDSARLNIRDQSKALLIGSQDKSSRWPEAQTLTDALAPYEIKPPSPGFLTRYGVYVVPAAFKAKFPAEYAKLQQALIEAREAPEFKAFIKKNTLEDLSVGKPGEALRGAFAADFSEISKLK